MSDAGDRAQAVADPVGLTVELLTRADPGLDPSVAREVITGVAAGRAKARRLALALVERPAVLTDGRSPAPLVVGALLLALRAAGAPGICAPCCTDCRRPLRGSFARRGHNWYCHPCGGDRARCTSCGHERRVARRDRHGRPHCGHCPVTDSQDPLNLLVEVILGVDPSLDTAIITTAVEQVAPGRAVRERLAWTVDDRPGLLTGEGHQAPIPAVLLLIDALCEAGARAIIRPACPGCGRVTQLARCDGGQRICRRCSIERRAQPCARCGASREPAARDDNGHPICARCLINDPDNQERCTRCGHRRPVHARTPDGPYCASCRPPKILTCGICGRVGPAEISQVTGQPWCTACQQRWVRCVGCGVVKPVRSGTTDAPLCATCTPSDLQTWRPCPSCGTTERLAEGPCPRCRLGEQLRQLLADDTGVIAPELTLLNETLAATDRPATVLQWLTRSTAATVLSELGHRQRPLTHLALDELTPSKPIEHLRSMLVATGALPQRDEQLVRLERWIAQTLDADTDPARRHLLHHYTIWHLLRRLRTRNHGRPITYGQATHIRHHLRGAIVLLDWLATQQLTLTTCRQADLDRWLAEGQATHRREASHFLRWAATTHQSATDLRGLTYTWAGPAALIDGEERWATARRLLHDDTIKPEDRAAGLLVLLYAQRAATISQLTTTHVDAGPDLVRLQLGTTPVVLPDPLAALIRTLVNTRTGHAALGDPGNSRWLFPGGQPGRPISAAQMGERLKNLGLRPTPARSTTLFSLAAQLPAAILARTLGIHIDVAVDWQHAAAGDWTTYAADISRRTTQEDQEVKR